MRGDMDDFGVNRRRYTMIALLAAGTVAAVLLRERLHSAWNRASGTVEHVTRVGERRTIRLDDGSRVELSVASTLRYPARFPADSRPVTLIGEGFFAVANDARRPFIVTAAPAVIETMGGATFGARAYPGQNTTRIVVDTGAVGVRAHRADDAPLTRLAARELARIARDGAVSRTDSVEPERYLGWRAGRIVLDDLPLRGALTELARWQRVELRIGDSVVANRRVTATFASHQTLTEMLDGIALQAGARYDRSGRTVTFRLER